MFHHTFHLFCISYKVSRQVTTVELHTFYHTDGSIRSFSFFDSNHTIFRNFTHSVCNQLTDSRIVIGRNSSHLFNLVIVVTYHFGLRLDRFNHFGNSFIDTTFQIHRICSGSNILQTYPYD